MNKLNNKKKKNNSQTLNYFLVGYNRLMQLIEWKMWL